MDNFTKIADVETEKTPIANKKYGLYFGFSIASSSIYHNLYKNHSTLDLTHKSLFKKPKTPALRKTTLKELIIFSMFTDSEYSKQIIYKSVHKQGFHLKEGDGPMDMIENLFAFHTRLDILFKLGLTAVLGMIIGMERQIKRKPVGLKTSLVISIVSCLLTIVSIDTTYITPAQSNVNISFDPLRLAAQIVSGIGFLGAGVILRRENDSISGLTTAAIIWGAAGIGIAVGAGFFVEAIAVVCLIIISVDLVPLIMNYIGPKQLRHKVLLIQLKVEEHEKITNIV